MRCATVVLCLGKDFIHRFTPPEFLISNSLFNTVRLHDLSHTRILRQLSLSSLIPSVASIISRYPSFSTDIAIRMLTFYILICKKYLTGPWQNVRIIIGTQNKNNLHLAIARGAFLRYNKCIQNHKTACRKLVLI